MGGQWDSNTVINQSKYTHHFADQKLDGTLKPTDLKAGDLRTITGTFKFDSSLKSAAFTRGDVTTGWDHTQTPNRKSLRQELQRQGEKAAAATQAGNRAVSSKGYTSPSRREEMFMEQQRQAKEKVVYRRQHLEKLYGPEGAEAMEAILAIGRKPAGRPGKAKAADLSAVLALPDEVARPGSASAEEQQEEGQKQQAGQ